MILEHALLDVLPGRGAEFEAAFDEARPLRTSPEYDRWRDLLHRFYDPFPRVEHFQTTRVQ